MKVHCRKQQAGNILNMKPIYNMYMFNNQKETDLQNFKTDESLIVFFKKVIALSNDVVAIIAHNKKYHIFVMGRYHKNLILSEIMYSLPIASGISSTFCDLGVTTIMSKS